MEDEDDAEAPKELLNLIDRHEMRSQPNIESPLEVSLETESEIEVVFIGAKLDRDLNNQLITLLNGSKDVFFSWSYEEMSGLNTESSATTTRMQACETKIETHES